MPNPEGRYCGSARTHDSIGSYQPFQSGIHRATQANYEPALLTEREKRFRTEAVPFSSTNPDLNETPEISTPVELGRLGLKAVTGPSRYGRSDEPRRAADDFPLDRKVRGEYEAAQELYRERRANSEDSDLGNSMTGGMSGIAEASSGTDYPAGDEALEGDNSSHKDTCDCDLCKADRAAGVHDSHMRGLRSINRLNRRAFARK
jgi:hypothetical protein